MVSVVRSDKDGDNQIQCCFGVIQQDVGVEYWFSLEVELFVCFDGCINRVVLVVQCDVFQCLWCYDVVIQGGKCQRIVYIEELQQRVKNNVCLVNYVVYCCQWC